MFGYVRPLKGELTVREYDEFRAVYCGLCHAMRKEFGLAARFAVNYEFTFLAMLLSRNSCPAFKRRRCIAHPLVKRPCLTDDPALSESAAYSVILAWYKLRDGIADGSFGKKLLSALGCLLFRRAYVRARRRVSGFDAEVQERTQRLSELEQEHCPSLDRMADCFAGVLAAIARNEENEDRRRVLSQLLYQLGRFIYITDAVDDLKKDFKTSSPNPLIYRFSLTRGSLDGEPRKTVKATAEHSINLIASAYALFAESGKPILENIIYLGLPFALETALCGKDKKGDSR